MRIIDVHFELDPTNNVWAVFADGIDGGYSAGRSVREAREMIKDAVALVLDIDVDEVIIRTETFEIPGEMGERLAAARSAREAAEAAHQAQRWVAQALRESGMTVRDVGEVLGVSYQRVQQITGPMHKQRVG